jgi:glutamate racemase
MDNRPVLFLDSGIGGLPYCIDFRRKNPQEAVCYLADTMNFPYGPREKEDLASILIALTEKVLKFINPKIIVLACNTATISALTSLRRHFEQTLFVGTVPALKPAAKTSGNKKVGLLGTERTIEEIRSLNLIDSSYEIFGVAAPELVKFVERHFDEANENEKKEVVKKYIDLFRAKGADSLVLGCTHFLFLLEEFRNEASNPTCTPLIEVFDSLAGITKRIEFLLDENKGALRAEKDFQPSHQLVLTSEDTADTFWQTRAITLGFKLCLLNQL